MSGSIGQLAWFKYQQEMDGWLLTFPDSEHVIQDLPHRHPLLPSNRLSIFIVQIYPIHELAVDVELLVEGGAVADANGCAASVAREMAVCLDVSICKP